MVSQQQAVKRVLQAQQDAEAWESRAADLQNALTAKERSGAAMERRVFELEGLLQKRMMVLDSTTAAAAAH